MKKTDRALLIFILNAFAIHIPYSSRRSLILTTHTADLLTEMADGATWETLLEDPSIYRNAAFIFSCGYFQRSFGPWTVLFSLKESRCYRHRPFFLYVLYSRFCRSRRPCVSVQVQSCAVGRASLDSIDPLLRSTLSDGYSRKPDRLVSTFTSESEIVAPSMYQGSMRSLRKPFVMHWNFRSIRGHCQLLTGHLKTQSGANFFNDKLLILSDKPAVLLRFSVVFR